MPGEDKKQSSSSQLEKFDDVFPEIVEVLTGIGSEDPETCLAYNWYKKILQYNVPYGKKNRGVSVVSSYEHFVPNATTEDLKIARTLGWCVELFQAYFLVTDDMMDKSLTRRGQPCWYKNENVGLIAINDAFYLESCIYQLLKKYIKDKPYYLNVLELFLETGFQTVTGQCLDMTAAPPEAEVDFTHFNMDIYSAIVKWKTAFYSFYMPVSIAMYMAGISDEVSHNEAKKVLLQMGHFFQVQDDYLDCYGTPEVIGKVGTDIQDNKCGWLICTALQLATEEQRAILKENYGRWDKDCVQKVKDMYIEMDLSSVFKSYEEKSYDDLVASLSTLPGNLPKAVFIDFANKIYKRNK